MSTPLEASASLHNLLQSLYQEYTCVQTLVEAGYSLDEAARWLGAWAGDDARSLWATSEDH